MTAHEYNPNSQQTFPCKRSHCWPSLMFLQKSCAADGEQIKRPSCLIARSALCLFPWCHVTDKSRKLLQSPGFEDYNDSLKVWIWYIGEETLVTWRERQSSVWTQGSISVSVEHTVTLGHDKCELYMSYKKHKQRPFSAVRTAVTASGGKMGL